MDSQNRVTGRVFESDYLLWAKTRSRARFNLATSGVPGYPLKDLGASIEDLEINGPGGYGYKPLLEAIGREYGVPVENIVAGGGTSGANAYAFLLLLGPMKHLSNSPLTISFRISRALQALLLTGLCGVRKTAGRLIRMRSLSP